MASLPCLAVATGCPLGPILHVCPFSRRLAQVSSELSATFQEGKAHCTVTHRVSVCITYFAILWVKASHKAKSRANERGDYASMDNGI